MLVTPALDFKNAASRMFTFRVRGDYLRNEQPDRLELCYIDLAEGNMYVAPVKGFQMPCTQDESGEWFEYHIDLDGQSLADKFFMAFRFTCERGRTSSATYYIDDVTYGRTDIPLMRLSANSLAFEAYPGTDALSTTVSVSTENLAEPITLTLGGANKSKFALTTSTLPTEGEVQLRRRGRARSLCETGLTWSSRPVPRAQREQHHPDGHRLARNRRSRLHRLRPRRPPRAQPSRRKRSPGHRLAARWPLRGAEAHPAAHQHQQNHAALIKPRPASTRQPSPLPSDSRAVPTVRESAYHPLRPLRPSLLP